MTDAELRIVEFLMTSDAARPADLPDWLLAILEGDRQEEVSHELITATSLLYARRMRPGIGFDAARALIAEYAADPATRRPLRSDHGVPAVLLLRAAEAFGAIRGRPHRLPVRPRGSRVGEAGRGAWQFVNPASTPRVTGDTTSA